MAPQTSQILIELKLQNLEGIDKLKSAFRELDKTLGVSSNTIDVAKRRLDEYVKGMDRSEQVIRGQLTALQGLRSQVDGSGATYRKFTAEIGKLEAELGSLTGGITKNAQALTQGLVPTDAALSRLRDGILATGAASKQTEKSLGQQIRELQNLRSQAALNGDVYRTLSADITRLTATVKDASSSANAWASSQDAMARAGKFTTSTITDEIRSLASLGTQLDSLKTKATSFALSGSVSAGGPGGVRGAIQSVVGLRQQLARSMPGRVVLTGEGIAAAGLAGAAGTGAAAGIGNIAAGLQASSGELDALIAKIQALPAYLRPLGNLLTGPASEAAASINQWSTQLSAAQAKLSALAAPFDAIGTAVASIGPEASAAAGVASVAIASVYSVLSRQADKSRAEAEAAFKGIGDDAQRALQQLVKLYDQVPSARLEAQEQLRTRNLTRLEEALPGSLEARKAANAVAVAEREINKIKAEQNKLLDDARAKQNASTVEIKYQLEAAKHRLDIQRKVTQSVLAEQQAYRQNRAVQRSIQRYRADIPLEAQTTTALSEELSRLGRSIANTRRDTEQYITLQIELANVQRAATAATQGLGAAMLRDLASGAVVRNQQNLQQAAAQLKSEMADLDTTTTAGFARFTQHATQVRDLEEEINRLGRAYATAAEAATQLRSTSENAALNQTINAARGGRQRLRQALQRDYMQDLSQAIQQNVAGTPLMLPAAGQTSAAGTGQALSGGARRLSGQVETTYGPIPELRYRAAQAFFGRSTQEVEYGPAATGYTPSSEAAARAAQRSGFAYRALAADIRIAQTAGSNSLTTLEAQRAAWTRLQTAVDIGSNKYRLAAKRIEELDQRMGRGGPPRLGGRQIAQIGGAAISGGIFGGPEGFLGGVIGGAFGVGGAFAGAAAGAQVGMLRQQLAGTTAYAAEIGKMQIALRGVSGSQANYNQAIQAAARLTNELNIPQREATAGLTRLSAAVLGAGGTMNDATFAFRAISESIKATGGNAEQVDGALLALTQVFSKGKVSAEELNQIAERLPGTFTLFAKATGKTGPELQKALQQGTVGLNDLMKFLELASSNHGQTALKIAASNEEAGARLQVAYDKMSLDIGKALAPIGAELQNAFADFITNLAPNIVDSNGDIGVSFAILIDPVQRIVDLFKELGKTKSDLQPLFEFIAYNVKALTTAFYVNNLVLEGVIKEIVTSAGIIAALLKGDFDAVQRITAKAVRSRQTTFGSIPQTVGDIWNPRQTPVLADRGTGRQIRDPRGSNYPSPTGTGNGEAKQKRDTAAADAQRTAESLAQQEMRLADAVFDHKQDLERKRYELSKELLDLETKNRLDQMGSIEREAAQALEQRRSRDVEYQERLRDINDQIAKAQRELLSAQRMATVTGGTPGRAGLPPGVRGYITGDPSSPYYRADHGGRNYHEHLSFVSRQAAEAAYNLLVRAGVRVTEFQGRGQVGRHAQGSAHYAGLAFDVPASQVPVGQERALTARVQRLLGIGAPGATGAQGRRNITDVGDVGIARSALDAKLLERKLIIDEKARRAKAADIELANSLTSAFRSQNEELSNTLRTETLRAELQSKGYTSAQVDLELKLAEALDRRNKAIAVASADTRLNDETRALAVSDLNAKYQEQVDLLNKIYNLNQANANSFGFREGAQRYVESIGTMRDATAQLTESGLKGLEDVLFQLTTTGTANFQEFAASILQQSARMIMQLLIQKTIMQIIGAIGGGGGAETTYGGRSFGDIMAGVNKYSANGNVFAANGIVPYAMGGIVNRPTYFPFANGGSIGTGLMGEAGPEAIIPLQRGANGKLGVAGGGGTTNIVVNVDASGGTSVSGDETQAKQLGQVVTAAVQAELIKQRRPGGLLSR